MTNMSTGSSENNSKGQKWYNSIVFRLSALFFLIAVVVIVVCGIGILKVQTAAYEDQSMTRMRHMGTMLRDEIMEDGETFKACQKYMLDHSLEIFIPYDFNQDFVEEAELAFNRAFMEAYPGKLFRTDVTFDKLNEDLKHLFCTYYHAKWFLHFEEMRDWYEVPYVYYVYPSGMGTHVIYICDTERIYEGDEADNRLHLYDDFEEEADEMPWLFNTWKEGEMLTGMDSFDNEYGRTYSYYVPVYLENEKTGLVCVDMDIDFVHSNITKNVINLVTLSGIIMVLGLALLAFIINTRYLSKLKKISGNIRDYSENRNVLTAEALERSVTGNDEIASLGVQTADMIRRLDEYMKNLTRKEEELAHSQEQATRDALTGVRNKLAYDQELDRLQWAVDNGETKVGFAMLDLNFLKKINDTYGHEKGNISIKTLCFITCHVFEHSPVFRIGGDEFVAILRGSDYENRQALAEEFYERLKKQEADPSKEPWEKVSAALGIAIYEPGIDSTLAQVFKRADSAMYEKKKEMKAMRDE